MSGKSNKPYQESMSDELLRIYTLRNFPRNMNISLIRLASAGFYYTGQSSETKCYACGVTYRDWSSGDDPMGIHRRISPSCRVVQSNMARNSSFVTSPFLQESTSCEVNPVTSGHCLASKSKGSDEIKTNSSAQADSDKDLVSKYSNNTAVHTDISNDQHNYGFVEADHSHSSNEAQNTESNGKDETCNRTCSRNPCDSIDRPRYPNYGPLHVRKSSFQGWPSYLDQTPHEMAMAGWLYAGYNDYTRCYYCGGGLRNWDAGDDPWVEHARWFPNCAFVRRNKGDGFIAAVLKKQEHGSQKSSSTENGKSNSASNADRENKDDRLLQSVAARSVLEMGYSNEQVLVAIRKISNSSRGLDEKTISATDIMNILLDEEQHVQGTAEEESKSPENQISTNVPGAQANDGVIGDSYSRLICSDTESIIEENRQLREQRLCKVCLDFEATIAFLPCGHIVCCTDCAPAMRKCPICRAFIKGTVKTYLS